MDLSVKTNYNEEQNIWLVTVCGEIDIFNSPDFKSTLLDLLAKKQIDVTIDCTDLGYIDSTGLGSLIAVLKKAKEFNGNIKLKNVKPNLYKLFKITNLDKVFEIEGGSDE